MLCFMRPPLVLRHMQIWSDSSPTRASLQSHASRQRPVAQFTAAAFVQAFLAKLAVMSVSRPGRDDGTLGSEEATSAELAEPGALTVERLGTVEE
jgi:hypothetical protein